MITDEPIRAAKTERFGYVHGTYVNVEPFHLFRYLDEQAFRFNERKDNDAGRFVKALRGIVGKGLRYAKLIGGDGIQQAGQTA